MPFDHLPSGLPPPAGDALAHGRQLAEFLRRHVNAAPGGAIAFDEWMDLALYAPGLGYYVSGSAKFADGMPTGDFTTAPELTPLFGMTLARQVEQILTLSAPNILEFGAGTGALAETILDALHHAGHDVRYSILELSPDLRDRQAERLARFGGSVKWLSTLPEAFTGCVLANEVLDAMPVKLFCWNEDGSLVERHVSTQGQGFRWALRPASPALHARIAPRLPAYPGYQSEINLRAEAWMRQMGNWLDAGAALIIDYGFPQHEYYHPQRAQGTLMCHYRHHAHGEPLILPGLQDITAHVDFTAMAEAAQSGGLDLLGYTSQARFLLNAGLPELMQSSALHNDRLAQAQSMSGLQTLLSEAEMGELFKVLAVGRNLGPDTTLLGFCSGDRRGRL